MSNPTILGSILLVAMLLFLFVFRVAKTMIRLAIFLLVVVGILGIAIDPTLLRY
ncbi:hypothetical protein [Sulfoacidibacillus thermotolerans]|uniref:hypothetical protein n=1 Tax=Sulfoacidibacillus thermotolerans TaxID=1765684 RepID=UPI0015E7F407|nr:hypothetical protein [Sulfoacidibacillus thermotolerans]